MLDEDNIKIDIRRIKQKVKELDGNVKIHVEKNWLENSKEFKKVTHLDKFTCYVNTERKGSLTDYLYLERQEDNLMVYITASALDYEYEGKGKWAKRWTKELLILYELFNNNNEEVQKLAGDYYKDFEIYKNLIGRDHMGNTTFDEVATSFKGWYCIKYDFGFDDLFRNENVEKHLNKLNIFNVSTHYDNFELVI